ncbi:MAG: hypothetical protein ACREKM_01895 [Longimicrobiales bacterium]
MRATTAACALLVCSASGVAAQEPTPRDTVRVQADSTLAADSAALAEELARLAGEAQPQTQAGPSNARLLPDISVVGDLFADVSPERSTQEDGNRFAVREIELALQAAVDPYFRGDVFLGISDEEGIAIEQAYLTTTSLPSSLELRVGRFLMPFGKQNLTHRHDLHTTEYPRVLQQLFGPEGLKGTGLRLSRIFAPFGFYQELQLTAVELVDEAAEDLMPAERASRDLDGLGYTARLRNYWDLSESSNVELSASALTTRRPQPVDVGDACVVAGEDECLNAVNARQSVLGADFTFRWRPLQQGLYESFILQAEIMKQFNEADPELPAGLSGFEYAGPPRDVLGAYVFGRYQLTRRGYVGGRFDWVQDQVAEDESLRALSGYLEFFPSEFSKLLAGYERVMPGSGADAINRLLLQATFALGPHKPHPF